MWEQRSGGLAARVLGRVDNGTFFLPGADKLTVLGRQRARPPNRKICAVGDIHGGLENASLTRNQADLPLHLDRCAAFFFAHAGAKEISSSRIRAKAIRRMVLADDRYRLDYREHTPSFDIAADPNRTNIDSALYQCHQAVRGLESKHVRTIREKTVDVFAHLFKKLLAAEPTCMRRDLLRVNS
jgi:hypothetical protein